MDLHLGARVDDLGAVLRDGLQGEKFDAVFLGVGAQTGQTRIYPGR